MKLAEILEIKPHVENCETVAAAICTAEEKQVARQADATEIDAKLEAGQLTLENDELRRLEADRGDALRDVRRLQKLIDDLIARYNVHAHSESMEDLQDSAEQANAAASAFVDWYRNDYPKYAAEIRRGFLLELKAKKLRDAYSQQVRMTPADLRDDNALPQLLNPASEITGQDAGSRLISDGARLPGVGGLPLHRPSQPWVINPDDPIAFWWPRVDDRGLPVHLRCGPGDHFV